MRKHLGEHDRARATCLARLGEHAVVSGLDLSGHSLVRDQISQLEGRAGGLANRKKALESDRARLEEHRRRENAKYGEQRTAVETKKQPIDAELAAARTRQTRQESEARSAQNRIQALARELEQLRRPLPESSAGTAPERDARIASARARIAQLEGEQPRVADQQRKASEAIPPLAAEVSRLLAESKQFAAEIDRIEAERKNVLQSIDADVKSAGTQLQLAEKDTQHVAEERRARFVELGAAVFDSNNADPRISEPMAAVAAEDQRRAVTQAAFDSSMALTGAMPPNTLRTFFAVGLAGLFVVLALPIGGSLAWQWWEGKPADEAAVDEFASQGEPTPMNPYLEHALKDEPAYVLANRLADARTAQEAQAVLLEVFRAIGLGVYAPDGRPVLRGAERSEKDLFLYDFQWKILARSQLNPSFIDFPAFAHLLGEGLAEFDVPAVMQVVLASAMSKRYSEASRNPTDPNSFIVLFLDGLARRQPIPYTLPDTAGSNSDRLPVSPVQSVLILLEFFADPAMPIQAEQRPAPWSLLPVAYAQSPCDLIKGEQGQKHYGTGLATLTEVAEEAFGLEFLKETSELSKSTTKLRGAITGVAKIVDSATAFIEFLGDLVTLYGIDIKVEPQPSVIHLLHGGSFVAGIQATVTFNAEVVSEEVLKCGWMAGKQMPPKGPMPGVEASWAFSRPLPPYLFMHRESGITSAGSEGLKTTTNEAGIALFMIQPADCVDRQGRIEGQDYVATVSLRVVTANIPTPTALLSRVPLKFGPGLLEYFMRGRKGYARFRAEWHTKRPPQRQYGSPLRVPEK